MLDQNGSVKRRSTALLLIFTIAALYLLATLFHMQLFGYEKYQKKVLDQITVGSALSAKRGEIYDRNGNLLATNKTVWRIWISPSVITNLQRSSNINYGRIISDGLSEILGIDAEHIYEKTQRSTTLDMTLLRGASEETKDRVLAFIAENDLAAMVHAEAGVARYYPNGTLASHVIGFTGSDNQGLFGLEYTYDEKLTGVDGKYVTAVDAYGGELPDEYSSYIPPTDGLTMVTTLDAYLQRELELQLQNALLESGARNRATGIVMNVKTGAILAMATAPSFDLNDPYTLDTASMEKLEGAGFSEDDAAYKSLKSQLLYTMWNNKAISEIYEPGSTFKIITSAMALEEKAVTPNDRFDCKGYLQIGGYRISCHKKTGHGHGFTFSYGLQQSCNPVLMQVAARVGAQKFYSYFSDFGYLTKTGVDLPSEALGLFHDPDAIGTTELATAAFGQRFKINPLQQIQAVAAVANGGVPVTPHLIERLLDGDGNTVYEYVTEEKERVISEATSKTLATILEEGVSGDGGAKNAYVPGYKIAAKTGTSQKFEQLDANGRPYLYVGSCIGFAPADDPEIAVLIIVDEPSSTLYYGSYVAAPYLSAFFSNALPYLGYEPSYTEADKRTESITVSDYTGLSAATARQKLYALGFSAEQVEVVGNGKTVLKQMPMGGSSVQKASGNVILYTVDTEEQIVSVPNVVGESAAEANKKLVARGLNIEIRGAVNYTTGSAARVISQSHIPDTSVPRGTVITITVLHTDDTD
ncbi:MAG: PASTA domain-containing protein [Clostridia bacterium]|nr:PASTA domain-containing protein [Clostridia bacterium]